jgi:hypothetical protein
LAAQQPLSTVSSYAMTPTPTAAEILAKSAAVYATCRSYQDTGEQTCRMLGGKLPGGRHTKRLQFRTAFTRPANLFFEYKEVGVGPESEWTHGIVCANAREVVKWWTLRPEPEREGTVQSALHGFAGVSGRTSYVVPKQLFAERMESQPSLGSAGSWHVRGTEEFEGRQCFLIGNAPSPEPASYVIWIDCESLLLRRMDERTTFNDTLRQSITDKMREHMATLPSDAPKDAIVEAMKHMQKGVAPDFDSETTTIWRPSLDIEIDPATFEFRQPREESTPLPRAVPIPQALISLTAAEILTQCADRYASCRTYRDSGESITHSIDGPQSWNQRTQRRVFRTFFSRPASLFIEYKQVDPGPEAEWRRALVCARDSAVHEYATLPVSFPRELPLKLHDALLTLMTASGGTPGYTPWLLLPHPPFFPLPDPASAELVGKEEIEGRACLRLRGHWKTGKFVDVWIDPKTQLLTRLAFETKQDAESRASMREGMLKRIESRKPDDPQRAAMEKSMASWTSSVRPTSTTENVTTFSGSFDDDIDPAVFEFRPPDSSQESRK